MVLPSLLSVSVCRAKFSQLTRFKIVLQILSITEILRLNSRIFWHFIWKLPETVTAYLYDSLSLCSHDYAYVVSQLFSNFLKRMS